MLVNAGLLSPWLARAAWRGGTVLLAGVAAARGLARLTGRLAGARRSLPAGACTVEAGVLEPAGSGLVPAGRDRTRAVGTLVTLAVAFWGAANGFLPPGRRTVPVLTYHRMAVPPRRGYPVPTTSPADFAWQIEWLASRGYRTVNPDRLERADETLPAKPLIITFDDGWRDNLDAARLLRRYGFSGIIFVVTGEIGRPLKLDAAQLRSLERDGFLIGSHTVTHPHLDCLPAEARWRELLDSRRFLEDLLGHRVELFASPYGSSDLTPGLAALIHQAGYRWAFASHNFGLNIVPPHPWAVRRLLVPSHPLLARLEFLLLLW